VKTGAVSSLKRSLNFNKPVLTTEVTMVLFFGFRMLKTFTACCSAKDKGMWGAGRNHQVELSVLNKHAEKTTAQKWQRAILLN